MTLSNHFSVGSSWSFFYDILIYSPSWSEHLRHVNLVLAKL
jgi:hypothetical protein